MKTSVFSKSVVFLAFCASTSLGLSQTLKPSPHWHTNGPPSVRIVTPEDGEALLLAHPIHICAVSQNFTDAVTQVEFFAGSILLGVVTNSSIIWDHDPFGPPRDESSCLVWSNAVPGAYTLTATATDLAGNSVTSAPVEVTVVTNLPPLVRIVKPANGATILGPSNVTLVASAFDPDGTVIGVEFFEGTSSLGVVTNPPTVWVTNHHGVFPIRHTSYSLTWSNVAPGPYSLTAVATDDSGASTTSAAVDITVVTNLPPLVKIASPDDGARFYAPANISISAAANDPDGTVASVEFFAGTTSLGVVTDGISVANHQWKVQTFYGLTWSNVPPGVYALTAVAMDNSGISSTSAPVELTVVTPPPPPERKIIYPANGANFIAPAKIYIAAMTRYFTNPVANVEFLAGTTLLGTVTNSSWPTFHWTNVSAGAYSLTVVATDTGGATVTSSPVAITVVTNRPHGPMWGH